MTHALLSMACHLYVLAAIAYFAYLVKQHGLIGLIGRFLTGAGVALHAAALTAQLMGQGGAPQGLAQGLSFVAFVLLTIFLVLDLSYRKPVLGAFLTPLALSLLVPALLLPAAAPVVESVRRPLLPVHISSALLGVSAITVAAGVAVMYLLLERQMKGKKFGLLFSRLPSLQFLDELNRHLVVGGFIALSLALVTGALFAFGDGAIHLSWNVKEVTTIVAWVVFASLISARLFVGWRGKKVALLTMAGFGLLLVSLLTAFNPSAYTGGVQ